MKRLFTLIFGLTILGLASSSSSAAPHYYDYDKDYDSRRHYDDYDDYYDYYDSNRTRDYLRDQDQRKEIERLRKVEEQKRLEEQKKYEEYQAVQERKRLEEEAATREKLRKYEAYQEAQEQEKQKKYEIWQAAEEQKRREEEEARLKDMKELEEYRKAREQKEREKMEELKKQFEMFLQNRGQNDGSLSPEQQRERKITQNQVIASLQEKIQNEKARLHEENEREQEKINRIVPSKWHAERKVKFLVEQLVELNSRIEDLIRNVQDRGISSDPNLGFIQRSSEFCYKGIQNLLLNGINNVDKTLTNNEDDRYRRR